MMISSSISRCLSLILSVLLLGAMANGESPDTKGQLSSLERRGKQIYLRGESHSREPVYAILGDPPMEVSAKMLPCVNCHGYSGRGIPEGGVTPSNIAWSALTKSYGTIHASGRRHGAYDEDSLTRAIAKGIDPSGNRLGVGMPKYRMSPGDVKALIAYIKCVEDDRDPGIDESTLTLATVLPLEGVLAPIGQQIREVLTARIQEVNKEGGIYNRKIDLRVIEAGDSPEETVARLRVQLDSEEIFAIVAPLVPSGEEQLAALAEEYEIPVIASLGASPDNMVGPSRYLFYLYPAPSVQGRALVDYCAEQRSGGALPKALLISRAGEPFDSVSQAIQAQCRRRGIDLQVVPPYTGDTFVPETMAWQQLQADVLFFLGPDSECARVLEHIEGKGRIPEVYLMGTFLGEQIFQSPDRFQGKIAAAFANSPSSHTKRAVETYRAFLGRHEFSTPSSAAALVAYTASKVMFDALNASGRELHREHLMGKLESLWEYETGLGPSLTFGPNRRVGAYGAYVVSVDLEARTLVNTNRWIEPLE